MKKIKHRATVFKFLFMQIWSFSVFFFFFFFLYCCRSIFYFYNFVFALSIQSPTLTKSILANYNFSCFLLGGNTHTKKTKSDWDGVDNWDTFIEDGGYGLVKKKKAKGKTTQPPHVIILHTFLLRGEWSSFFLLCVCVCVFCCNQIFFF